MKKYQDDVELKLSHERRKNERDENLYEDAKDRMSNVNGSLRKETSITF